MKKMKKPEMTVEYIYVEPKTKAEKEEQERRVNHAFDILFEATLEDWNRERGGK